MFYFYFFLKIKQTKIKRGIKLLNDDLRSLQICIYINKYKEREREREKEIKFISFIILFLNRESSHSFNAHILIRFVEFKSIMFYIFLYLYVFT